MINAENLTMTKEGIEMTPWNYKPTKEEKTALEELSETIFQYLNYINEKENKTK